MGFSGVCGLASPFWLQGGLGATRIAGFLRQLRNELSSFDVHRIRHQAEVTDIGQFRGVSPFCHREKIACGSGYALSRIAQRRRLDGQVFGAHFDAPHPR